MLRITSYNRMIGRFGMVAAPVMALTLFHGQRTFSFSDGVEKNPMESYWDMIQKTHETAEKLVAGEGGVDVLDLIPSSVLDEKTKLSLRQLSLIGDDLMKLLTNTNKSLQHPMIMNIGLLRLYLMQLRKTEVPSTTNVSEKFIAEAKYFLRYAVDAYEETPYISTEDIVLNKLEDSKKMIHDKVPRHVVFLDHLTETIVVSIRGTGSISDVLTDLHCDTVPFLTPQSISDKLLSKLTTAISHDNLPITYAHSGIAVSAKALLDPVVEAIKAARSLRNGRYKKYDVVVTGHSLGAGTACLLSLLLSSKTGMVVTTFAYAPPPVISRDSAAINFKHGSVGVESGKLSNVTGGANCMIHSFVHHNDIVPRSSQHEIFNMLNATVRIDDLPWSPTDRYMILMRG